MNIQYSKLAVKTISVMDFQTKQRIKNGDDIANSDDIIAHKMAVQDYVLGETISHNDIDWN